MKNIGVRLTNDELKRFERVPGGSYAAKFRTLLERHSVSNEVDSVVKESVSKHLTEQFKNLQATLSKNHEYYIEQYNIETRRGFQDMKQSLTAIQTMINNLK